MEDKSNFIKTALAANDAHLSLMENFSGNAWYNGVALTTENGAFYFIVYVTEPGHDIPQSWGGFRVVTQLGSVFSAPSGGDISQ